MTRLRSWPAAIGCFVRENPRWSAFVAAYVLTHAVLALTLSPLASATIATVETCLLAWGFVVLYHRKYPLWRRSIVGRLMMSLALLLAVLASLILVPDAGFGLGIEDWVSLVFLMGMTLVASGLVRLLFIAEDLESAES